MFDIETGDIIILLLLLLAFVVNVMKSIGKETYDIPFYRTKSFNRAIIALVLFTGYFLWMTNK
jgi:hypothetical protein